MKLAASDVGDRPYWLLLNHIIITAGKPIIYLNRLWNLLPLLSHVINSH